ncbi:MAG: histidine phosphatase family protein [Alphaproteobacteria bacterium]|jgi:phosphohistidine phosphatase|nr:histidine phosphatase family protein [Alphaproteobacteria bacterium]
MVTLHLLRHAKAKSAPELRDIDRPLAERGHRDADTMGQRLAEWAVNPALILCSSAQRARETLAGILPHLSGSRTIEIEEGLYNFDQSIVFKRVSDCVSDDTTILVIGHNPALEQLTGYLAADGAPSAMRQLNTKFPTCALATLEFTFNDWASIGPKTGRLIRLSIPGES